MKKVLILAISVLFSLSIFAQTAKTQSVTPAPVKKEVKAEPKKAVAKKDTAKAAKKPVVKKAKAVKAEPVKK
jgi:uncharacterized protein YdeI (BOF family)